MAHFQRGMMMEVDRVAQAMRDEEMLAEIEDFIEGFNQPTYRGMRGQWGSGADLVFGLEIEPNLFAVFNISLSTADGETHVLTQSVNGLAGARFFGWVGDVNSMQITCSSNCAGDGFAIGELFIGGFAGTPGKPNCHGKSVSALAQKYGGLPTATTTLGFSSVQALQDAIKSFCGA